MRRVRHRASSASRPSRSARTCWKPIASNDRLRAMFTGIITDVGQVRDATRQGAGDLRLVIATAFEMGEVALGASIACSGVCLTVVEKGQGWFAVDVSGETCARTTVGSWQSGRRINLERSL